jgi:phage tail-like protein
MSFGADRVLNSKGKFLVQTSDLTFAAFQSCTELSVEYAKIEYHEGGAIIPMTIPGRATYTDVTLSRGTSPFLDFHNWALRVGDASLNGPDGMIGGYGQKNPVFKADDLAIQQYDLDNVLLREWVLVGAFPQKYTAGDWDNSVDEVVIEQLIITYDYFKQP